MVWGLYQSLAGVWKEEKKEEEEEKEEEKEKKNGNPLFESILAIF